MPTEGQRATRRRYVLLLRASIVSCIAGFFAARLPSAGWVGARAADVTAPFREGQRVRLQRKLTFQKGTTLPTGTTGLVTAVPGDEKNSPAEVTMAGLLFDSPEGSIVADEISWEEEDHAAVINSKDTVFESIKGTTVRWSDAIYKYVGKTGTIRQVDSDDTLQLLFDDGILVWLPFAAVRPVCLGHGSLISGKCECDPVWTGEHCGEIAAGGAGELEGPGRDFAGGLLQAVRSIRQLRRSGVQVRALGSALTQHVFHGGPRGSDRTLAVTTDHRHPAVSLSTSKGLVPPGGSGANASLLVRDGTSWPGVLDVSHSSLDVLASSRWSLLLLCAKWDAPCSAAIDTVSRAEVALHRSEADWALTAAQNAIDPEPVAEGDPVPCGDIQAARDIAAGGSVLIPRGWPGRVREKGELEEAPGPKRWLSVRFPAAPAAYSYTDDPTCAADPEGVVLWVRPSDITAVKRAPAPTVGERILHAFRKPRPLGGPRSAFSRGADNPAPLRKLFADSGRATWEAVATGHHGDTVPGGATPEVILFQGLRRVAAYTGSLGDPSDLARFAARIIQGTGGDPGAAGLARCIRSAAGGPHREGAVVVAALPAHATGEEGPQAVCNFVPRLLGKVMICTVQQRELPLAELQLHGVALRAPRRAVHQRAAVLAALVRVWAPEPGSPAKRDAVFIRYDFNPSPKATARWPIPGPPAGQSPWAEDSLWLWYTLFAVPLVRRLGESNAAGETRRARKREGAMLIALTYGSDRARNARMLRPPDWPVEELAKKAADHRLQGEHAEAAGAVACYTLEGPRHEEFARRAAGLPARAQLESLDSPVVIAVLPHLGISYRVGDSGTKGFVNSTYRDIHMFLEAGAKKPLPLVKRRPGATPPPANSWGGDPAGGPPGELRSAPVLALTERTAEQLLQRPGRPLCGVNLGCCVLRGDCAAKGCVIPRAPCPDVLLFIHTQWCWHCRGLIAPLAQVARLAAVATGRPDHVHGWGNSSAPFVVASYLSDGGELPAVIEAALGGAGVAKGSSAGLPQLLLLTAGRARALGLTDRTPEGIFAEARLHSQQLSTAADTATRVGRHAPADLVWRKRRAELRAPLRALLQRRRGK